MFEPLWKVDNLSCCRVIRKICKCAMRNHLNQKRVLIFFLRYYKICVIRKGKIKKEQLEIYKRRIFFVTSLLLILLRIFSAVQMRAIVCAKNIKYTALAEQEISILSLVKIKRTQIGFRLISDRFILFLHFRCRRFLLHRYYLGLFRFNLQVCYLIKHISCKKTY